MHRNQSSFDDPEIYPHLTEAALRYLEARAVSPETAKAARLSSLTGKQIDPLLGLDLPARVSGLGIPYLGEAEVSWRVRLSEVGKERGKWRTARGEPVRPYFPPPPVVPASIWEDVSQPLYVAEGPIKALALSEAGYPCIGLGGVETGHDPEALDKGEVRLHPEILRRVALRGRVVTLVFDAGRVKNERVALGEARFALACKAAGASARLAALPLYRQEEDQGPDDFLALAGKDALAQVLSEAYPADPVDLAQQLLSQRSRKSALRAFLTHLDGLPMGAALHLGGAKILGALALELRPEVSQRRLREVQSDFAARLWGKVKSDEAGADPDEEIARLNREHALICVGSKVRVLWERYDREWERDGFVLLSPDDFALLYKDRTVSVGGKNVPLSKYWLSHPQRRRYDGVAFDPSRVEIPGCYNLWRGLSVSPAPGDWGLLREHVREVICNGEESLFEYVLNWCAWLLQRPTVRPGVALVLQGKEGAGKGLFFRELGLIFGRHFFHITNNKHLTGSFNAHLAGTVLLFADEALWAGDKAGEGSLKGLITEPLLGLERKGIDLVQVDNFIWLVMASNNDWAIPAGPEARRFCVLRAREDHLGDSDYFARIVSQMDAGGREAMLHELVQRDLSGVDLRQIPDTPALFEQKLHSLTPIQRWLYSRLMEGQFVPYRSWTDPHPTEEIYQSYLDQAKNIGDKRRASLEELGLALKSLIPAGFRHRRATVPLYTRDRSGSRIAAGTGRVYCYLFPALPDCRDHFAAEFRSALTWPEDDAVGTPEGALSAPEAPF